MSEIGKQLIPAVARFIFAALFAISASLLSIRALAGPFHFIFTVDSPMNLQSACALCFLILIFLKHSERSGYAIGAAGAAEAELDKSSSNSGFRLPTTPRGSALKFLGAACLWIATMSLFWRALSFYFLSDDFVLLAHSGNRTLSHLAKLFITPGGDGFFRPVGYLALSLNAWWAGYNPFLWHLSSLILHTLNCLLVFLIASKLLNSNFGAGLAAMLFGLHGTRPEAVAWVAGGFDLLAAFFALISFALFITHVETAGKSSGAAKNRATGEVSLRNGEHQTRRLFLRSGALRPGLILSLSAFIAGLLSKESVYALPLVLVIYIFLKHRSKYLVWRISAWYAIVAVILFAYRWGLLGGPGGYRASGTNDPELFHLSAVGTAKALLLRIWGALFFPINWSSAPGTIVALTLVALLVCLFVLSGILHLAAPDCGLQLQSRPGSTARTESRHSFGTTRQLLTFCAGFTLAFALPALPQLLIGSNLQKSRLLYLPSVGWALLVSACVLSITSPLGRRIFAAVFCLFQISALQHNLSIWRDVSALSERTCRGASENLVAGAEELSVYGLPNSIKGVYFFANGFPECVAMRSGRAIRPVAPLNGRQREKTQADRSEFEWEDSKGELKKIH